jgi:hypothetical protein
MGGGWSTPCPGCFTSMKDPVPIVFEAGWAPGPVWTGAENLTPTRVRSLDRPAHSKSLYQLSYSGQTSVGTFYFSAVARHFLLGKFVCEPNCWWTGAFVNRGPTVYWNTVYTTVLFIEQQRQQLFRPIRSSSGRHLKTSEGKTIISSHMGIPCGIPQGIPGRIPQGIPIWLY